MSRYILIRPIHLSQKKYKNMHLEQIRSCGHKFLNCTRLEILTHGICSVASFLLGSWRTDSEGLCKIKDVHVCKMKTC